MQALVKKCVKWTVSVPSVRLIMSSSWTASVKVCEMKKVLRAVPEAGHCLERHELETLVSSRFESLEEFQGALEKQNTHKEQAPRLASLMARTQTVLSQDRNALNFDHYKPSEEHVNRLQKLAKLAPELYNNPNITPRSKWFAHPRFRQNSQMPPFHVHFRYEMQSVIRYLYEAYSNSVTSTVTTDARQQSRALQRAHSTFQGSMRGLNGHVSIEEYACFPMYKDLYPHVPIQFLYEDHRHLHAKEKQVEQALMSLTRRPHQKNEVVPFEEVVSVLETVLEFDEMLISHLGEEEEIVVPMSLTEKDVLF